MASRVWTHPIHKYPAFAGLCLDIAAFVFVSAALFSCLYIDARGTGDCSPMIDSGTVCDNHACQIRRDSDVWAVHEIKDIGWQHNLFMMAVVAFAVDFTSVALQLLVFWPLVMMKGVFSLILRMCSFLDFASGILKFIVAWTYVHKQRAINNSYVWFEEGALKLSLMPSAYLQLSLILSFVAVVMLRVATDEGTPGEPSYLEIIDRRHKEEKLMREMGSRTSIYKPQSVAAISHHEPRFSSTSV